MTQIAEQDQQNEIRPHKNKPRFDLKKINLQRIGAFIGSLAAIGSLVGISIAIYNYRQERPDLELNISQLDLVTYIPQSQISLSRDILDSLNVIEAEYRDITGNNVLLILENVYSLIVNSNRISIKHPETGTEPTNFLDALEKSFKTNLDDLKSRRDAISGSDSEKIKQRYTSLISDLENVQKKVESINSQEKIFLEVRAENSSRLSNYLNSQGILMFRRDENSFSAVPQIIVSLPENNSENSALEIGRVDGYGASSIIFESELSELEKDNQTYVDFAFKSRSEGDEAYSLIFAIEDIKGRMWYEEALFSTFTDRKFKQELKGKAERVFNKTLSN